MSLSHELDRINYGRDRAFWFLLVALLAWRLLYLLVVPLDLSPDEAYYWDWSRHLDWGYYSKPPMVAWLIGLSTSIFGNNEFGVRMPAALLGTCALVPIFLIGKGIFCHKTGFFSAIVVAASPAACVGAMIMTIDAPLLFFWAVSVLFLFYAMEPDDYSRKSGGVPRRLAPGKYWWYLTGLTAGLGLLSKQTMLAFWPVAFLVLAASHSKRHLLKTMGPYIALLISILATVPVLIWNWHHQWITFQHTAHHFKGINATAGLHFETFLRFVLSQIGLISPITWSLMMLSGALGLVVWARCILSKNPKPGGQNIPLLTGLGPALFFLVMILSLRQQVNANWPAPFYLTSAVLVSAWALGHFPVYGATARLRILLRPGLVLGAAMAVFLYLVPLLLPALHLNGTGFDPTVRLRGWHELGTDVGKILEDMPRPEKTFILAGKRQIVSELAFYVPGTPRVYRWHHKGGARAVTSQYEIWGSPLDKTGWDCLFISKGERKPPGELVKSFEKMTLARIIQIPLGNNRSRSFRVYYLKNLIRWPG